MNFENKTFVVTGGGGGLGRELVLNLLSKGSTVIALDRNAAGLEETKKCAGQLSKFLFIHQVDITDREAVISLIHQVIAGHERIDGLFNNAGIIQPFIPLKDLDEGIIEKIFNVNFFGTLNLTKVLLPHLLTRPEAVIVNIASMGGFLPVPGQSIYCASKAAVKLMTEGLQAELKKSTVQASVVFPGAMKTDIMTNSGLATGKGEEKAKQAGKILSPKDAAAQILNGVAAGKPRIFIGTDSKLMDFLYRLSPALATNMLYKKLQSKLPQN
ncbi:SDR family NAD(P)-dependent oxidoreductase [Mucilaginibacter sp. cycad4]|uniref:SDR family NAD(P)-dependent oxidoreductase n=1 Tax=Mucilaginibacter sp. cycad4 TaxID=3342096 RepID=UPI002AAA863A|nr:SDR family NAD(P)-dependent oxidoreductase [Mucilaginibacter gossypii]WPV02009.1 SDR family NAD(P)-dependent oxidoreductase [Mucilaginibacter gossypii]